MNMVFNVTFNIENSKYKTIVLASLNVIKFDMPYTVN